VDLVRARLTTDQTRTEPYQSGNGQPTAAPLAQQTDSTILSPLQVFQVRPATHGDRTNLPQVFERSVES